MPLKTALQLLILGLILTCRSASAINVGQLAIIIDDVGYTRRNLELLNLPRPITLAILPDTPYGKRIAKQAAEQQRPLMLHLPMQARNQPPQPGMLNISMNKAEFTEQLERTLDEYPWVSGVNNHMGSAMTRSKKSMNWLMQTLVKRHLFFVDSRTSSDSVAEQIASTYPILYQRRHVFLDHEDTPEFVSKQLRLAINKARKQAGVIAIGHPKRHTVNALKTLLPELLKESQVELVTLSELLLVGTGEAQAKPSQPILFANLPLTHLEQCFSESAAYIPPSISEIF
jgi:polysaccharide deacetylase 2 family uncharacterized protein YibQ